VKCPKCGNSGPDIGAAFCAYCGAPLVPGAVAPPRPSVPPARTEPLVTPTPPLPQGQPSTIPKGPPPPAKRRRRLVWAVAAVFVLALCAAVLWPYSRPRLPEIHEASIEPARASVGTGVWVTVTLYNSGAVESESGEVQIDFRQATRSQPAGTLGFPALAPGEEWTGETLVTVPAGASLGVGRFVVTVYDGDGDPTNKTTEVAFTVVEAPRCDLVVSALSTDPAGGPAGSKVTVGLTIRNQGERTSEACSVTFVIQVSGMDDEDLQSNPVQVPVLAAGKTWTTSASVTIPSDRKVGVGSIIAWVDREGIVSESDSGRANNTRLVVFTVVEAPQQADLVVSTLSVAPTSAPAGSKVTVGLTIRNQGARTSEVCAVTLVIHGYGMVDEDLQNSPVPVPAIVAGQSWTTSVSVTIPSDRKVGVGSILARVDRAGKLSESDSGRANNTRSVTFTVGEDALWADLVVLHLAVDPKSAPAGSQVAVDFTIRNQGERTSVAGAVTLLIRGSEMVDELLIAVTIPAMAVNVNLDIHVHATIPSDRNAGQGSIIARIERNPSEDESGGVLNTRSVAFAVTE